MSISQKSVKAHECGAHMCQVKTKPYYTCCNAYQHLYLISIHAFVFAVRLVNGPTEYEGRVEVYYNDTWGTVCDNGWDLNDAEVVCRELGYGKATAAIHRAVYGQGSGQIWLDDVKCVGTEQIIGNCSHRGWGLHYCYHWKDASVSCLSGDVIS